MKFRPHFRGSLLRVPVAAAITIAMGLGGVTIFASAAGASPGGSPGSFGATYYVDFNGSGTQCSLDDPCGSIGQALSDAYSNGEEFGGAAAIEVGPGPFEEDGDFVSSEFPPEHVTITGVPGQTTIFPTGSDETGFGVDCGTLTLQDLEVIGFDDAVQDVCGTLIIDNSEFGENNVAVDAFDGDGYTSVTVTNSSFFENEEAVLLDGDQATLNSDSLFYNGAGVINGYGTANVINSTFYDNETGIVSDDDGSVTVSDSTIDANNDGLVNENNASLFGTIIVNNYADNCAGDPPTDNGFNIDNYGDCDLSSTTGSITGIDPNVGSLQNNGGDTWTQAILPTSIAYQQIPVSECPSVDQRGESRPQPSSSNFCDIGAYEWAPPTSLSITTAPVTGPTSAGANLGDVDVALTDAAGFPAVSPHAVDLDLSTTDSDVTFAETPLGLGTNQVEIPSGNTGGAFFFGSTIPQSVPLSVTGWDLNTNIGTATQTETVVTGPPAIVNITAGNSQSVDVGTAFSPLSVNVTDGTENPEMDSPITFTVTGGDATFPDDATNVTVNTDDNGNVTAPTLTAGTVPGPVTVDVTTTTSGVTAEFDLTQLVGPPTYLTIDDGNSQSTPVTNEFGTDLSTTLTDEYGNDISGATVTYTVTSGSSRFGVSTTDEQVTDGSGDTTADTLSAGTVSGTQTITASVADSVATVTFSGVVVTPGAAANITITSGNNQTALSTRAFGHPLSTTVTDTYGNPIDDATVTYDVTNGSATFSSGTTEEQVTDANGDTSADLIAGLHVGTETVTASVNSTSVTTTFSGLHITAPNITSTVSPFALNSDLLTANMKGQISFLALEIELVGYNKVTLTGYSDATGTTGENTTLSLHRARVVKTYLLSQLHTLGVGGVTVTAVGKGATHFLKGNGKLAGNRRVVAVLS